MKILSLFIIFALSVSSFSFAQDAEHPVQWRFSIEQTEENTYLIKAEADLADDFHIWALDAGGDGSLIPTSFEVEQDNEIRWKGKWLESPDPIVKELEYIEGPIRWHEHKVVFTRELISENPIPISASVSFQVCNAQSCFPPETQDFRLQVKGN